MSVPNRELVVYVLALLGGDTHRVRTEDLALKCFELFPTSFSWTHYPKYPDKDIVRVALTDARKEQYGGLVEGRYGATRTVGHGEGRKAAQDGWMLTPKGIGWLAENRARLEALLGGGFSKSHRQAVLRRLEKFRNHPVFRRFGEGSGSFSATLGELADMLGCRVDTDEAVWRRRLEELSRLGIAGGQKDVTAFVDACEKIVFAGRGG